MGVPTGVGGVKSILGAVKSLCLKQNCFLFVSQNSMEMGVIVYYSPAKSLSSFIRFWFGTQGQKLQRKA